MVFLSNFYGMIGLVFFFHDMSTGMGLCCMQRMVKAVLSLDVIAVAN